MLTPEREKKLRDIFSANGTLHDYEINELFEGIESFRDIDEEREELIQECCKTLELYELEHSQLREKLKVDRLRNQMDELQELIKYLKKDRGCLREKLRIAETFIDNAKMFSQCMMTRQQADEYFKIRGENADAWDKEKV